MNTIATRLEAVGLGAFELRAQRREVGLTLDRAVARTRSSTSTTRSNSIEGLMMWRAKMLGRAWEPMRNASRKPLVVSSSVRSPLRSSSALVATVVPS
jgi:hypothetical protein